MSPSGPSPSGSPAPDLDPELLGALQRTLSSEHTAVYGYGLAGAVLPQTRRAAARTDLEAHRARRDRLVALLVDRGANPTAAAPSYRLPEPVTDARSAARLLVRLEEAVAAHYADVVLLGDVGLRRYAAEALQDAAVRAARWRGRPVPFPGLPERDSSG